MNKQPEQSKPVSLSQNHPDWADPAWGQQLADNLNRNVLASAIRRDPGPDWSFWTMGEKTFAVSPDRREARRLEADGYWNIHVLAYVLANATVIQDERK